jgi:hypothetical protein
MLNLSFLPSQILLYVFYDSANRQRICFKKCRNRSVSVSFFMHPIYRYNVMLWMTIPDSAVAEKAINADACHAFLRFAEVTA